MNVVVTPLVRVGRGTVGFFAGTGRVVTFAAAAVAHALRLPSSRRASSSQALSIAVRCLVPVVLVTMPIGAMLALQSLTLMRSFGVERMLSPLVAATIVRELAPGFAAVVVAMQGGAGIAAELGAMRARDEIDALELMGLEPRGFVAGPRILGAMLATPLLNLIAVTVGLLGAYLAAVPLLGVPHGLFLEYLPEGIAPADLWISEGKCLVFGAGTGALCATAGYHAEKTARGVGAATNRAVVASVIYVLTCNYILNTAIFGLRGGGL